MPPFIARAGAAALFGTLAGTLCLVVLFAIHPTLTFEMDRDLPRIGFGFYPVELSGPESFAWTSERAQITLADADRRSSWRCAARFRGGRPDGSAQPAVSVSIDGVTLATTRATNEYQDLDATAPPRPSKRGLSLAITSSTTFVPGPSDPRALGVQVDRLRCGPIGGALVFPPRRAVVDAALATAAFAAAMVLVGLPLWGTFLGTIALASAQAVPLSTGAAPYTPYVDKTFWIAVWIAAILALGVKVIELLRRQPIDRAARFALLFSAAALYLKLLGLLHPSKLVIDAVFHAHRLEWVLAGRYFFTQPMPNGVQFPYAIALYLFAAPWSALTRDYVTLLRIVVSASEAVAGALLYWIVVRNWDDRLAGAAAVVFFNVVPLAYVVLGNANLTNAFGQSMAVVAIALATTMTLSLNRVGGLVALLLVTTIALLSHVSTFALLVTMLGGTACFYWWIGGAALRASARAVLLVTAIAVVISVVSYYGHFTDVYSNLGLVRAEAGGPLGLPTPFATRVVRGLALSVSEIGWPLLGLGAVGLWRLGMDGGRDRLTCALAGWAAAYAAFVLFGVLAPVGLRFERYAVEFISRVDYATYPAVVILAARGGIWAWRAGPLPRSGAVVVAAAALFAGAQHWMAWFE